MKTVDLRKLYKKLYQPSAGKVELVDVPRLQFAMIDGAIEKGEDDPVDYPVMSLEGLWWVEDGRFDLTVKDNWRYTLMIMQPKIVTPVLFADALAQLRKKHGDSPALSGLRLGDFAEGPCVQTMHVGLYATEPATVERMRSFMQENGLRDLVGLGGKHHELYLGDPRKAAPEKLKTVLRHPAA